MFTILEGELEITFRGESRTVAAGVTVNVMEDAPWAPVFNEQRFTMHSDKLGGPDAIFVDPVHIPVHYDYVHATDAQ